jgi:hypothetical protein
MPMLDRTVGVRGDGDLADSQAVLGRGAVRTGTIGR